MAGRGVTDRINFEWETDHKPTEAEVATEQAQRGYHPAGYGDPFDIKTQDKFGPIPCPEPGLYARGIKRVGYKTTWSCWGSCD